MLNNPKHNEYAAEIGEMVLDGFLTHPLITANSTSVFVFSLTHPSNMSHLNGDTSRRGHWHEGTTCPQRSFQASFF
jgi:hypothetical protein